MSWHQVDDVDRTAKILIDSGRAVDSDDARRCLQNQVLQVAVGPGLEQDRAGQAALATAVNTASRAFLGGVHVRLDTDPVLTVGWTKGHTASDTVCRFGGTVTDHLVDAYPTVVIGAPGDAAPGAPVLYLQYRGWCAAVLRTPDPDFASARRTGITPAGILAAALGVSETFQQQLGAVTPGRRDVGLSLWRPDLPWREAEAVGPELKYLPSSLWLLGLGHLGQAFAWTLGLLPYANPGHVQIGLVDFDVAVKGNTSTQLLTRADQAGQRKTRITAAALEELGIGTRIVDRGFDKHFHSTTHANPARNEPTVALAGFDSIGPRQLLDLDQANFTRIVDAGLGAGPVEYLDMVLHTFPAARGPALVFAGPPPAAPRPVLPQAYEDEIDRQVDAGKDQKAVRCGMLDVAGVTVGAAFVGAAASTFVVADLLRVLHGGAALTNLALDLRQPEALRSSRNDHPEANRPPLFTTAH